METTPSSAPAATETATRECAELVTLLQNSEIYRDYQRAFQSITGAAADAAGRRRLCRPHAGREARQPPLRPARRARTRPAPPASTSSSASSATPTGSRPRSPASPASTSPPWPSASARRSSPTSRRRPDPLPPPDPGRDPHRGPRRRRARAQAGPRRPRGRLQGFPRGGARAIRRHPPPARHLRPAALRREQPAHGQAIPRRGPRHHPRPRVHRGAPDRGHLPRPGLAHRRHEPVLLLQELQEEHRPDLHRIPLPHAHRGREGAAAQPLQARQRGRLRGRLPVALAVQPRVPPHRGPVPERLPRPAPRPRCAPATGARPTRPDPRAPRAP